MSKKSLIAAAVGTAFVAGMSAAPIAAAAENPFALSGLSSGYQVADNNKGHDKMMKEGKCGEGKCGEGKCGTKMKDGKCGGDKAKAKEGKCGEGKCGGDKAKAKEGKCGEGKCGGTKK
jgi:uncharacterized low-complexity protein